MIEIQTIARYQPGGDLYATLAGEYGSAQANTIAAAAATGDQYQLNAAMSGLNIPGSTADLKTNTLAIFGDQLATNPLGAPLASLNNVLSNTFGSLFSSPAVLITLAALVFFFVFDGVAILKKYFK